ncbi:MAG: PrsW family glutamic-type intramembrane protease [Candidatus Moraniibacteriota bacterium]
MLAILAILFGILAAGSALIAELLIASFSPVPITLEGTFSFVVFFAIVGIALIEEIVKYVFLRQYVRRFFAQETPSLKASLSLGTLFGLGFAAPEIYLATGVFQSFPLLAFPSILAVHIMTSVAFALFLFSSSPRFTGPKRQLLVFSLIAAAVLLHTLYNTYVLLVP